MEDIAPYKINVNIGNNYFHSTGEASTDKLMYDGFIKYLNMIEINRLLARKERLLARKAYAESAIKSIDKALEKLKITHVGADKPRRI